MLSNTTKLSKIELIQLVIIIILLILLYASIIKGMIIDWYNDPNYSHGFIIPIITAYIIYERRGKFKNVTNKPDIRGLFLIFFGLGMLIIGTVGSEQFTMRLSIVPLSLGIIWLNFGILYFKLTLFPILYLIFMIPLPYLIYDQISLPLKNISARFATFSLQLFNIPVFRDGNIIELSNTKLEVADACSGIRSLISLLALSVIFSYVTQESILKRYILIIFTIPIAIFTNMLRVSGTGILAHFFGEKVAQGFFHTFSGWLIFLAAIGCLYSLNLIMNKFSKIV